jgi:hypothetical protein
LEDALSQRIENLGLPFETTVLFLAVREDVAGSFDDGLTRGIGDRTFPGGGLEVSL